MKVLHFYYRWRYIKRIRREEKVRKNVFGK